MKKRVLMTGAGGVIGTALRRELEPEYTMRCFSKHEIPGEDTVVGDINDLEALTRACEGMDSVIHLAADGSPRASWESVLHNNITGTYSVYEAASRAGVKQVIFASSNHAVGNYDLEHAPDIYRSGEPVIDHLMPVRPDSYYGVSKSFGESLGRYYAECKDLRVICLRIGSMTRQDQPPRHVPLDHQYHESPERLAALWISQRDLAQLVQKSLEAEQVTFDIFYGVSNNTPHYYDLEHARTVLGYEPQDGADVSEVFISR
ncbi:NAD-dependent epimerase/dehydratase family protein [Dictyobacter aurantiacus]|uniref:NAD-dependent epimerase n=1 Tax=Dictyobacter aurantiacus TaxID=1936993 RepID=A0A401ZG03_9CHLR|nr:NAD(P)-dependent oxidoreductase [Dictyobacter aurantiacus]GCE05733.1 NAD-dependent epimerase [Dictyobacter aurantiacus]